MEIVFARFGLFVAASCTHHFPRPFIVKELKGLFDFTEMSFTEMSGFVSL